MSTFTIISQTKEYDSYLKKLVTLIHLHGSQKTLFEGQNLIDNLFSELKMCLEYKDYKNMSRKKKKSFSRHQVYKVGLLLGF